MEAMTSNIKFNISELPVKKPGLVFESAFYTNDVGSIYA